MAKAVLLLMKRSIRHLIIGSKVINIKFVLMVHLALLAVLAVLAELISASSAILK